MSVVVSVLVRFRVCHISSVSVLVRFRVCHISSVSVLVRFRVCHIREGNSDLLHTGEPFLTSFFLFCFINIRALVSH